MTRDEQWDKMTIAEKDTAIAEKVMGWQRFDGEYCIRGWHTKRKGVFYFQETAYWSPTTDISAFWQVVEKMEFDIVWRLPKDPILGIGPRYCVGYSRGKCGDLVCYSRTQDANECLSPICDTPWEAGCKAAYLVVMESE